MPSTKIVTRRASELVQSCEIYNYYSLKTTAAMIEDPISAADLIHRHREMLQ
jgi:L-amino acid N-acyltransferase YncA